MIDKVLALILLVALSPLLLFVYLIIKLFDPGPALYWSKRIGINNCTFNMPKFRSMKDGTPAVATHLLKDSQSHLSPVGEFIRKTSLDELPQLFSILKGEMVFVGPRPALFNQHDLIEQRTKVEVHKIKPGITGWAQVNGRDEISIERKVQLDREYFVNKSLMLDLKIIYLTFIKVILRKDVRH